MIRRPTGIFGAVVVVSTLMLGPFAAAQLLGPNIAPSNPPPPAPPPPPKIEVPAVPQLDAPPRAHLKAPRHKSFDRRIRRCLEQEAAAGYDAGDRAAYSRACAHRD